MSLEEVERLLPLLGCPLPERCSGLYSSQVNGMLHLPYALAEVLKDREVSVAGNAVGTGAAAVSEKHKIHYQMALKEISAKLADELGQSGLKKIVRSTIRKRTFVCASN